MRETAAHSLTGTLRAEGAVQREGGLPCIQLMMSVTKTKGEKMCERKGSGSELTSGSMSQL